MSEVEFLNEINNLLIVQGIFVYIYHLIQTLVEKGCSKLSARIRRQVTDQKSCHRFDRSN